MNTKKNNLLIIKHPELLSEWDYEKNNANNIDVNKITYGSRKKAWWRCGKCHGSYDAVIKNRTIKKQGCPFCVGKKLMKGFNDLASCYPDLVNQEWDWVKNSQNCLQPDCITSGSNRKAWWICITCKGSYESAICDRTHGYGCPYCAGKKILKGFNDLQSCYSELVESEWNWLKNDSNGLYPDEITKSSKMKAWWQCDVCKGEYEMAVNSKTTGHQGCPYCAGKKILKGFNDLESCYPELVESEWDYEKNNQNGLKPDEITKGSGIKVWWRCSQYGHSWHATVHSRTGVLKTGCPSCAKRVSKQENEVSDFISNYLHNHVNMKYTIIRSIKFKKVYNDLGIDTGTVLSLDLQQHLLKELDVYIPKLGFAIEYDGDYWHDDKIMLSRCGLTNDEMHKIKKTLCSRAGIELLFISEHDWVNNAEIIKNILMKEINTAYNKSII